MEKKSAKKPASPTFPPSVIRKQGEFPIGGHKCEVYNAHGPGEGPIDTASMITRGSQEGASVLTRHGNFLRKYQTEIPAEYAKCSFLFPMGEVINDEYVGLLKKDGDMWYLFNCPEKQKWDNSYKLVRIVPDLPLPPLPPTASTKIPS